MHDQNTQLTELRQTLDRLSRKIDFIYDELHLRYPDEDVPLYVLEAREHVRQGRDSEAVKVVREHTAIGIVEARAVIEEMRERYRMRPRSTYV